PRDDRSLDRQLVLELRAWLIPLRSCGVDRERRSHLPGASPYRSRRRERCRRDEPPLPRLYRARGTDRATRIRRRTRTDAARGRYRLRLSAGPRSVAARCDSRAFREELPTDGLPRATPNAPRRLSAGYERGIRTSGQFATL